MCGRYTHTTRRSDDIHAKLADTLGVETPASEYGFERFNVAPTQAVLAVVDDREGRRIEELRWGLVPHWAREVNTRFSMINARAETLHQKPAYRGLARRAQHCCLILADGYYEWQRPEDPKQPRRPVHFSLDGDEPFCCAGLWTRWRPAGGEVVPSCAIVTCPANAFTRPIHDRMPGDPRRPRGLGVLARPRGRRRSRPRAARAAPLRADGRTPRQPNSQLAATRGTRLPRRPRPRSRRASPTCARKPGPLLGSRLPWITSS